MRADQDAGTGLRAWEPVRFRLWACVPALVLSVAVFLLAIAGDLSDPAVLRPTVRVLAWLAAAVWATAAGLGWDDRRRIAAATRPNRLAQRYALASITVAVVSVVAGLSLSVGGWAAPDAMATVFLAVAGVGATITWQVGLAIQVDLAAAAHIRGARPLALPGPRHSADTPARESGADTPARQSSADGADAVARQSSADDANVPARQSDTDAVATQRGPEQPADLPTNVAAAAGMPRRPRRHR